MNKMNRQELARWGEGKAKSFLEKSGIRIIHQNFRTKNGEIDLIGLDKDDLIFFEVKARSSKEFGYPEDAVNFPKIEKIEVVANEFIDDFPTKNVNWRIDVVAIIRNPYNEYYDIKWFKDVVS
ncbi:MAG: YraN family protein [Anaerolineaceae bacterium]|nr:YraN family protein [Anaerolineaceae bacterium]